MSYKSKERYGESGYRPDVVRAPAGGPVDPRPYEPRRDEKSSVSQVLSKWGVPDAPGTPEEGAPEPTLEELEAAVTASTLAYVHARAACERAQIAASAADHEMRKARAVASDAENAYVRAARKTRG